MKNRRTLTAAAFSVAVVIAGVSSLRAGGERRKPAKPEDVILVGKVVDLQSYMTDKFTNIDPVRATQDSIRQGVPAALVTEEGLIVIGMGERGPSRTLIPLAFKKVEMKGKLYEKDGLLYIDMASATMVRDMEEAEESEEEIEDVPEEEAEP